MLSLGAIILILILSIGLWVRLRTTAAVTELVETLSDGKYGLKAEKIRVDPIQMRAIARKIYIYPIHTGNLNNEFELKADSVSLELKEIFKLLLFNELNVKDFTVINPVLQLRVYDKTEHKKTEPVPLHLQVAKIQSVFFKVLESLKVNTFKLQNGSIAYYPELNETEGRYFLNNINLDIDNLHLLEKFTSGLKQNKAAIHFELKDPVIEYPDSTIRVDLKHLDWNTRYRHFEITGLGIHKSFVTEGDSSGFQLQDISLDSMNWNKLLTQGIVELGALSARKGYFSNNDLKLRKKHKDTLAVEKQMNLLDILGPIYVRQLSIHEIEFLANTHTKRGPETIRIIGDELIINKLVVDKDLPNKVQLDDLNLKVKAFLETDSSKTFRSGFGEINIRKNNLTLKNYYLHSLAKNRLGENKVDVQELQLVDLSIGELMNGKLKAKELVMLNPNVKLLLPSGKKQGKALDWQKLQTKFNKRLDIGLIRINNAHVLVQQENRKEPLIKTDSFYAIIASRNVLRSQSLEQLFATDNSFAMPKLALRLPNMHIDLEHAVYDDNSLSARAAKGGTKNGNLQFSFKDVQARDVNMVNILRDKDTGLLRLLHIGSGDVQIKIPDKKQVTQNTASSQIVRTIYTGPINISVQATDWKLRTALDSLRIEYLRNEGKDWYWQNYLVNGGNLQIDHPALQGSIGKFFLGDGQPNRILNGNFVLDNPSMNLVAGIPQLTLDHKIHSTNNALDAIGSLVFQDADIRLLLKTKPPEEEPESKPRKVLPAMSLVNPAIVISKADGDSIHTIASVRGGSVSVDPMTIEKSTVSTAGIRLDLKNIKSEQEKFAVELPALKLQTGAITFDKGQPINTQVRALNIQDGRFQLKDSTKTIYTTGIQTRLDKSFWFNSSKDSLKRLLTTLPHLTLGVEQLFYEKSGRRIAVHQLKVNSDKKQIGFDSLHWIGIIPRDSFFQVAGVQKDFINLHAGAGLLNGYEMQERGTDTVWTINQMTVANLHAVLERDKRYPVDSINFRPLMTGMLQKLPIQFALERIQLSNAAVRYNEISEKKGKEGSIWFSDINATIRNIRNFDLNTKDSLTVNARAKLMGKGNLQLSFRESYTDSLRGFFMLARMGKMELDALSPLLYPLFNVKIDHGSVDTLWLRVRANDYLAYGKMDMEYHKLKLSLQNDEGKKKGFTSFLINALLKSNNEKTGMVYRERLRNKSMFNYWGKIAMSGLLTNMGVQKSKRQTKKYTREMKNLNLPPDLLLD